MGPGKCYFHLVYLLCEELHVALKGSIPVLHVLFPDPVLPAFVLLI
jgi:hypothetical protein